MVLMDRFLQKGYIMTKNPEVLGSVVWLLSQPEVKTWCKSVSSFEAQTLANLRSALLQQHEARVPERFSAEKMESVLREKLQLELKGRIMPECMDMIRSFVETLPIGSSQEPKIETSPQEQKIDGDIVQKRAEVNKLAEQIQTLKAELSELLKERSEIQAELQQKREEISKERLELDELKALVGEMSNDIDKELKLVTELMERAGGASHLAHFIDQILISRGEPKLSLETKEVLEERGQGGYYSDGVSFSRILASIRQCTELSDVEDVLRDIERRTKNEHGKVGDNGMTLKELWDELRDFQEKSKAGRKRLYANNFRKRVHQIRNERKTV